MEQQQLNNIIEAVLISAEKPLKVNDIEALFAGDSDMPSRDDIRKSLQQLEEDYQQRGFELKQVASGYRIQVRQDHAPWVGRLWEEKPARYTRALLETIALIAYRQPITRGEIEEVRGVSVSSNIIKTLMEREWIRVLGHKDVPGKPALYGTTKEFLDYFNLKSLDELPTLAEIKDLDKIYQELDLDVDNTAAAENESAFSESEAASAELEQTVEADTVVLAADEAGSDAAHDDAKATHTATAADDSVEAVDENDTVNLVAVATDEAGSEATQNAAEATDTETTDAETTDTATAVDDTVEVVDEHDEVNLVVVEADEAGSDEARSDEARSDEEADYAESEPRAQSAAS